MRSLDLISLVLVVVMVAPAQARDPERPITDREPDAVDVAKTPMTDLNLSRTEVPALLVEAQKRPYSLVNLRTCAELSSAVKELDDVLGPDLDLPQAERARFSEGRIAQWAIGTLIPFRSLIRELSGANRQEREIRIAIQAGMARRGFLKGVGTARNCAYPASRATQSIVEQHAKALEQDGGGKNDADRAPGAKAGDAPANVPPPASKPVFTSNPVVQPTR